MLKHSSIPNIDILLEDNHLLIINKPSGELVQGDSTGDKPLAETCKDYIKSKFNKPGAVFLGVIHRLDRPVSGVVAFARTSKSLDRMNALFRDKKTKKTYWAVVKNKPAHETGTLVHWLKKDENRNKTTAYSKERVDALKSELSFKVLGHSSGYWLLEVNPVTGRPHQIRVQLASMGCPIVGDVKYGYEHPNEDASICLHAKSLEFVHPVKKESIRVEAPLPNSRLWNIFNTPPTEL
ncbi:MAG: RluA family pseudouridine synthase [Flammeovirgaceae bacterium]|nr:RluA family pseudouridine synthase [Flammeovirgaceae bacterium]